MSIDSPAADAAHHTQVSEAVAGEPPRTGRQPDVGECRYCGSAPAVKVTQQAATSFLVFMRYTTWNGWMCRDCAEAVHIEADAKTMKGIWWGPASIVFWVFLWMNKARMRKVRGLEEPHRTPGVEAELDAPMVSGVPWTKRRGPVVATAVFSALWLLVIALIVIGVTVG